MTSRFQLTAAVEFPILTSRVIRVTPHKGLLVYNYRILHQDMCPREPSADFCKFKDFRLRYTTPILPFSSLPDCSTVIKLRRQHHSYLQCVLRSFGLPLAPGYGKTNRQHTLPVHAETNSVVVSEKKTSVLATCHENETNIFSAVYHGVNLG